MTSSRGFAACFSTYNPYPEANSKTETYLKSDIIPLHVRSQKRCYVLEVLIELLKMRARWWRVDGEGKVEGGRGRRVRVEGREGGGGGQGLRAWLSGPSAGVSMPPGAL